MSKGTSVDVLPSKNQALCEYCTHVSLNIADILLFYLRLYKIT